MNRTWAEGLAGLEENVIPIQPVRQSMRIQVQTRGRNWMNHTVTRRQYPMTSAYAFTHYRSQGQTIPAVIVDVARPPTGKLSLFNLYVALSRSSGQESIQLLQDFEEEDFLQGHDTELLMEDDRLDALDKGTQLW
ncbi:hypothetical protein IW262DRAFT_226575 [Armillaria fumosa]|nr:hypothetical protein IW262DRAFT_226575 [Armillaria fumosa]